MPRQLAPHLVGHEVSTVTRLGWAGLGDGELIRRAAAGYDVLVTGDQGLEHQQNLASHALGVVVIAARDNRVETVLALAREIRAAIAAVRPGRVARVVG